MITWSLWRHLTRSAFVPFSLCKQLLEKEGAISVHRHQPGSMEAHNNFLL